MQKAESKQGPSVDNGDEHKGVGLRLLGVVAIILGFLDCMLSWRGGFGVEPFYIALILGAVILYITRELARRR